MTENIAHTFSIAITTLRIKRPDLKKKHEYIRYVIPKGRSMQRYTQENINTMSSHINSTARDGLNGNTLFDLALLL